MSLPRVVYIYEDKDTDDTCYLVASRQSGELDKGLIGVYDLRETLHVRHPLEYRRHGTKQWFKAAK